MKKTFITTMLIGFSLFTISGCGNQGNSGPLDISSPPGSEQVSEVEPPLIDSASPDSKKEENTIEVITDPDNVAVLVNSQYSLPKDHQPNDLVYPNVPFMFEEKIDKRKMRQEAAKALEELFAEAKDDGLTLLGVSAFRSYQTQQDLFHYYVQRDGEEKARTYSAVPGHSEHQTGLAIDVTGGDLTCLVEDCFGDTVEGMWLAENAARFGFIIRYPDEKTSITGYQYEPWHLRYIGKDMATIITTLGFTLEEYMNAIPE
jgi:zinc D-Ala-D-Ala carboxypeptidase